MKKKFFASLLIVLVLLSSLTGCGVSTKYADTVQSASAISAPMTPMDEPASDYKSDNSGITEEAVETEMAFPASAGTTVSKPSSADTTASPENTSTFTEKIIYSGHVTLETTTFDEALLTLEQAVASVGGFIQDSNVQGYTSYDNTGKPKVVDRWADYCIRVPVGQFEAFMTMTGEIGNVTNSGRTAQNVTSQYTDYEARLSSLNTQEERLLDMLEKSGDLESLIQLEARLSEVRYEIESIERNLQNLDQRIAYSTVNLTMQEVELYTPTIPVQRTFREKVRRAFVNSWSTFAIDFQNFIVDFIYAIPSLLTLAFLIVVIVLIVKFVKKKKLLSFRINFKKALKKEQHDQETSE